MMITVHPSMKRLTIILACILALCACATPPTALVEPDPTILRVGVSPDAPPLIFKQNDRITGLEAEMAMALASHLEKTAVLVETPWENQIPALLDNRIDIIMSGMSVTPAREYKISFAKPYFKSGLMILVKDLNKFTFIKNVHTVLAQSITWRIGVVKGTTGESFTRLKSIGAKSLKAFTSQEEALNALVAGRIDVFIHDAPVVLMMAAKHQSEGVKPLPVMLNEEYLAWGLRKNDPDRVESVNAFIDQARQDGSLQTTIKRWIPLAE
jgi:ABC-type amino acid transport substrate-binding protein